MKKLSLLGFLNNIVLAKGFLHGKWKNKKNRSMYLLRCRINPFSSVRYYHELSTQNTSNLVTWRLCSGGSTLPAGNDSAAAEMLVTFN